MALIDLFPQRWRVPPGFVLSHWQTGARLAMRLLAGQSLWVLVSPPEIGSAPLWLDSRELAPGQYLLLVRSAEWVLALGATPEGQVAHTFLPQVVQRIWRSLLPRVADQELLAQLQALPEQWPMAPLSVVERFYQEWLSATVQPPEEWARSVLHEMFTPLSTIGTWTKLLLKYQPQLPLRVVQGLQAIAQEVRARQEQWRSWFEPQATQSQMEDWQQQAQARGIALDLHLMTPLPEVVWHLLAQVMPLLLGELPPGAHIQGAAHQKQIEHKKVIALYLQFTPLSESLRWGGGWQCSPHTGRLYPSLAHWQKELAALGGELHWQAQGLELLLPLDALSQQGLGDAQVGGGCNF
ncbi:MAG: hypothetical protein RMI89_09810 [Gloeomargarita sp. SKYBB_i_bin120]|nr:hypothetical protein [Gloeomargarita sp. SKYG98]MCS7293247.1 hypothetical protein [Gloeomargarita sp. SKYB120]MDW8178811.1 hypothetical protein [Gloeomargarita sp. SKYBB_i_bin120]